MQGQLHHTRCIYNALADIKAEVEATIKLGRKLVEGGSLPDPSTTTANIDSLKETFNMLGAQVTEARGNLERGLEVAESLAGLLATLFSWFTETENLLAAGPGQDRLLQAVTEMKDLKGTVRRILAVKTEFVSLCGDPSLLAGLRETLAALEQRWSDVKVGLEDVVALGESELGDLSLDTGEHRLQSPPEEGGAAVARLQQFRVAFQEVRGGLEQAEQGLERDMRYHSQPTMFFGKLFCTTGMRSFPYLMSKREINATIS